MSEIAAGDVLKTPQEIYLNQQSELKARTTAVEKVLSNQPVGKLPSSSCPNTSSSSSSPTERGFWPQEGDSEDQDTQSDARKMKRSRSCLSKSKRRRSPGTSTRRARM
ncbi:hypothetical protein OS493_022529 [Desmophyllum pertusum]|uniref:Uncharacterized protein n=1 Tax=Desmophyllum pertusum TaxID=174260 RepID=A0A9W9ZCM2_9CNID|nr:hypothetical protein OS493_022529 [Desmophyllum pertusum]